MARPGAEDGANALWLRTLSALALAPPVLAAIHLGAPWFDLLVAVGAAVLAWEWIALCRRDPSRLETGLAVAVLVGAVGLAAGRQFAAATALLAVGAAGMGVVGSRPRDGMADKARNTIDRVAWPAGGMIYLGLGCLALIWMRNVQPGGREMTFWLFATVWAVDIGAYACGRLIGGPRLAPSISPKKTWAGLIGGVACAGVVGASAAEMLDRPSAAPLGLFSMGIAMVAQAGDLAESWAKRRFGVKDSSNLIPGHGGVFDRVDGLLLAGLVTTIVAVLGGGALSPWP